MVVERIETPADHREAEIAGADYFQGFFFARPSVLTARAVPSNKLTLIQLLARVNDPESTLEDIVDVLATDVAMSVKALRFVNSAAAGLTTKVDSIQHAAVLLGRDTLRSWTSLTLMSVLDDKPAELVSLALSRAKFCELVARHLNAPNPDTYYAVGMLSLLDVMFDAKMPDIVEQLPVDDTIRGGAARPRRPDHRRAPTRHRLRGPRPRRLRARGPHRRRALPSRRLDHATAQHRRHRLIPEAGDRRCQPCAWVDRSPLRPATNTSAARSGRVTRNEARSPRLCPSSPSTAGAVSMAVPDATAASERGPPLREARELHQPGEEHGVERCDAEPGDGERDGGRGGAVDGNECEGADRGDERSDGDRQPAASDEPRRSDAAHRQADRKGARQSGGGSGADPGVAEPTHAPDDEAELDRYGEHDGDPASPESIDLGMWSGDVIDCRPNDSVDGVVASGPGEHGERHDENEAGRSGR